MNKHLYLRAYMAGIVAPTMMLLVVLSGFLIARYAYRIPIPVERVIIFPMALIPNLFGVWNILYLWLRPRRHLPIGPHGALLPFVLAPIGFLIATRSGFLAITPDGPVWFQQLAIPYALLAFIFAGALILYYLVWKYLVAFFNQVLEIA